MRHANAEAQAEIVARAASEQGAEAARRDAETAREEALTANRAKSDFLAAMSHEIRTPLNSIIGFTDLMLRNEALQGLLKQQMQVVHSAGRALLTIVNDVLDFSRMEAGNIEMEAVPFAPRELCANTLAIIGGIAASKDLDITSEVDPDVPEKLIGDPARLQQLLLNLLNNAVKFTAAGHVALRARVEQDGVPAGRVRFSVSDTGIGIEEAKQQRLFHRFSQADASVNRRFGGSGLGLAICKQLVDAMGGEIGLTSEPGRGATFWFAVPLAAVGDEARAGDVPAPIAPRTGRLLLVEDVEVNRWLACSLLESEGYEVEAVATGEEAVAALRARSYDLVLMDVQMPGMDGIAATRAIRALPRGGNVPIVALTANVLEDQVRALRAAHMDDHVGKPINRIELIETLARWLPAGGKPCLDHQVFDDIAGRIGADRTRQALAMFMRDLQGRFCATGPVEREALLSDAHVVTSVAGFLGFTDLSRRCAALASVGHDDNGFEVAFANILRAKRRTLTHLDRLLHAEAGSMRAA